MAEYLPNELWLTIFSYLHKMDVLISFNKLNTRFQQMANHYLTDINLNDTSYELFHYFLDQIVPTQGHHIHSLVLKNNYQLQLFQQAQLTRNICQYLQNLEYLELSADDVYNNSFEQHLIDFVVKKLIDFPKLIDFRIYSKSTSISMYDFTQVIKEIFWNSQSNVTDLTLLNLSASSWNLDNLMQIPTSLRLPNITSLTITIQNIRVLDYLLPIVEDNLGILNLVILSFIDVSNGSNIHQFQIPDTLRQLQIEFGSYYDIELNFNHYDGTYYDIQYSIYRLKPFLLSFGTSQLECLTLIGEIDNFDECFVQLNEIKEIKDYFQTRDILFRYSLHTFACDPLLSNAFDCVVELNDNTFEIYSNPRPMRYDKRIKHSFHEQSHMVRKVCASVFGARTLSIHPMNTSSCNFLSQLQTSSLLYLNRIVCQSEIDCTSHDTISFLQLVIQLSPNLASLHLFTTNSKSMIELFRQIELKSTRITRLICQFKHSYFEETAFSTNETSFHRIFPQFFANSLPHLKHLHLTCPNADSIPLDNIHMLRILFKNLITLNLSMTSNGLIEFGQQFRNDKMTLHQREGYHDLRCINHFGNVIIWF